MELVLTNLEANSSHMHSNKYIDKKELARTRHFHLLFLFLGIVNYPITHIPNAYIFKNKKYFLDYLHYCTVQ